MKRIIYASVADPNVDESMLDEILDQARTHNAGREITGILLFGNGVFIQVLEGEDDIVDRLAMHIEQDPRHNDFDILYEDSIERRAFGAWDMAYKILDQNSIAFLNGAMAKSSGEDLVAYLREDDHFARNFIAECAKDLKLSA